MSGVGSGVVGGWRSLGGVIWGGGDWEGRGLKWRCAFVVFRSLEFGKEGLGVFLENWAGLRWSANGM